MQKKREPTDTASNAIRFGGVWLEYHERIEFAERELSTARYLCDEVTVERDLLLAEKAVLEQKFKESIASLTQTETNHLEAKQIVDKVRSEQEDLARRCLAAEAHTEWLEDQIKQLKVSKAVREEEIASLQFRIENLKSSVSDGESVQEILKKTLSERDAQIVSLQSLLKTRDEEILVQSRSLHSKDRQLAQVVRERNAFKDDLTDTQRALALARRTGAVGRKCDVTKGSGTAGSSVCSAAKSGIVCSAAEESAVNTSTCTTSTTRSTDNHTTTTSHPINYTINASTHTTHDATTVLRKYKSSLRSRGSVEGAIDSASVLLEDILLSVLTPDVHSGGGNGGTGGSSDVDSSVDMSMDVVCTNTTHISSDSTCNDTTTSNVATNSTGNTATTTATTHILTTPVVNRKSPLTLSDAPTATLHLDEHDLDYINDILDTSADTVTKIVGGGGDCESAMMSSRVGGDGSTIQCVSALDNSSSSHGVVLQKALFGASPVPAKSGTVSATSTANTTITGTSAGTGTSVASNPWAVRKAVTPNRTRSSVGSVAKGTSRGNTPNNTNTTTNADTTTDISTIDVRQYIEREQNYKYALYLLQEEVRLLRTQVAGYEQAKRTVRGTPKKSFKCTAGSSAGGVGSSMGSCVGSVRVMTVESSACANNSMHRVHSVGSVGIQSHANRDIQCLKRDSMCRFNQHGSTALKGKVLFA